MAVSIVHRATGSGMATVGTILFVWWLSALASSLVLAAAAAAIAAMMWRIAYRRGSER